MLAELFIKTLCMIMFSCGTVLGSYSLRLYQTNLTYSRYFFFAAMVLFVVGSLLFVIGPWKEVLDEERERLKTRERRRLHPSK